MIICAGGFGNSGNTAIIDFFRDTNLFIPFSKNFGESSIFRDKYGIHTAMSFAKAGKRKIPPNLLKNSLSGLVESANEKDKNIYIRNKRVIDAWGEEYSNLLEKFIITYEQWYQDSCVIDDLELAATNFITCFKSILLSANLPVLVNNDPPGFNPIILEMGFVDRLVVSVRDPVDSCHDWIKFYKKPKTKESVDDYINRYEKKVSSFINQRNKLTKELREKITILSFEDFVLDENYRYKATSFLLPELTFNYKEDRFSPAKSKRNIGEGYKGFDEAIVHHLNEKIREDYYSLLEFKFIPSNINSCSE